MCPIQGGDETVELAEGRLALALDISQACPVLICLLLHRLQFRQLSPGRGWRQAAAGLGQGWDRVGPELDQGWVRVGPGLGRS